MRAKFGLLSLLLFAFEYGEMFGVEVKAKCAGGDCMAGRNIKRLWVFGFNPEAVPGALEGELCRGSSKADNGESGSRKFSWRRCGRSHYSK